MEKVLSERILGKIHDYYPHDRFLVTGVNRVNTKAKSFVYKISLFDKNKGPQDLYAKKFNEKFSSNIREIMGLKQYHSLFLIPRIIDFYEDETIVLSEGSTGKPLTRTLLCHMLSLGLVNFKQLITCSRKMGNAIGSLHNQTNRGVKRLGDQDLYLINDLGSNNDYNKIVDAAVLKNIRNQVDDLKDLKTSVSQYHADPSPHNILLKGDEVHLIDHSFQEASTLLDPSSFIVSLELARHRMGPTMQKTVKKMEHEFLNSYTSRTGERWESQAWNLIKIVQYLRFLLVYSYRETTPMKTLVSTIDKIYLLKKVRRMGKPNIFP